MMEGSDHLVLKKSTIWHRIFDRGSTMKSEMLNTQEAARTLGMSIDNLRELCRKHVGPRCRKGQGKKGHYKFRRRDLFAWHNDWYQSNRPPVAQSEEKVGGIEDERSQTLSLRMQDDTGYGYQVEFEGEWIINLDEEMRASEPESDLGTCYAAAKTKGERYALYSWHINDMYPPEFDYYEEIDEMVEDIPSSIIDAIKIRTMDNHIVKLDL